MAVWPKRLLVPCVADPNRPPCAGWLVVWFAAAPPNSVPAFDAPAVLVDPNKFPLCVVVAVDVPNSVPAEGAAAGVDPNSEGFDVEPKSPPDCGALLLGPLHSSNCGQLMFQ